MSAIFELNAQAREALGKGASRCLRRQDSVPAILYGSNKPAQALTLAHNDVQKALQHEAFYSHILTLHIDGKAQKVVLKDLQRHPFRRKILHMDFLRVDAAHKLTMNIPLHFIGDDVSPGIKDEGLFTKHMIDLEVRCLPADLPEYINVDISEMKIGDAIHLSEVKLPKGVELTHKPEDPLHDVIVASIHEPRDIAAEEAEEAAAAAAAAAEDAAEEGAEATAEGEAAGEGETSTDETSEKPEAKE